MSKYRSRTCFVPGCKAGYSSQKNVSMKPSLFSAPKDSRLLQLWQKAIPRKDMELCSKNVVCSLHFVEEDIVRYYECTLPDGTVNKLKRGKPFLKEGAIPCIFPSLPAYLSNAKVLKRKSPLERHVEIVEKMVKFSDEHDGEKRNAVQKHDVSHDEDTVVEHVSVEELVSVEEQDGVEVHFLSFEELKKCLNEVSSPNGQQWSGTFIRNSNMVLFAEWNEKFIPIKRVLISSDMKFKIMFGTTVVQLKVLSKEIIENLEDLETLLNFVSKTKVCSEIKLVSKDYLHKDKRQRKEKIF